MKRTKFDRRKKTKKNIVRRTKFLELNNGKNGAIRSNKKKPKEEVARRFHFFGSFLFF